MSGCLLRPKWRRERAYVGLRAIAEIRLSAAMEVIRRGRSCLREPERLQAPSRVPGRDDGDGREQYEGFAEADGCLHAE
jgi:hypothetical protein